MNSIIVSTAFLIPSAIFSEAFLSFLGIGIQAPMASWGTLANDARSTLLTFPHGREEITVPVAEFRNNATWALVKVGSGQESYGILLKDTYGKGQMYTLTVPDSFPDVYKLPMEVLTRLHAEFPVGDVYLEAGPQTSLFMYDNDSFIVYPYVEWGAQPAMARIHVKGQVNALVAPTQKDRHGDPLYLEPLYTTEDETVFEIYTMPGQYVIYQIDRN